MAENLSPHPFTSYLQTLADDRGALAALRRGLGRTLGTAAEMYPYVVPRLPDGLSQAEQDNYYLVAALFAFHPLSTDKGNLGDHLAGTIRSPADVPAVERRFVWLLNSHRADLPDHLRQTISYLRAKEQPVNWHQLLRDVCAWGHPERYVQRHWANSFWRTPDVSTEQGKEEEGEATDVR